MDYKEKVEWLGRYQASVSCQHMLEEEIEVLRSDAERVTACMSGMPGRSGPNADRLPRAVERIDGGSSAPSVPAAPDGCGGDGRAEAGVKKISVNFPKISQNFIVFHNQQW